MKNKNQARTRPPPAHAHERPGDSWITIVQQRSHDTSPIYRRSVSPQDGARLESTISGDRRGGELAVLDFDKAFSYLREGNAEPRPWRSALVRMNLKRHCLFPHLPQWEEDGIMGKQLWDEFEAWCLKPTSSAAKAAILRYFSDTNLDLNRIEEYFKKLATDPEDFFLFLSAASQP